MEKGGLSALVVVHNEAERLEACLAALGFVDEVVVVLDRSTDGSRVMAEKAGAVLVEGAWPIEGERRAAGVAAAAGPFILEVDADELVSPSLAGEIRATVQEKAADWWRIPFDNYVGDRWVRYGWGAQMGVGAKAALFRKGVKSWGKERVHPRVTMTGRFGKTLINAMHHDLDRDISDMIQRLDRYSTLHAQDLVEAGKVETLRKNVLRILGRFWKCYVRRKGYREGGMGLVIALCAGLYPFLSFMKAEELRKTKKKPEKEG
jgi:glycosyltransferase involved in cell wall biosynthesis